MQARITTLLMFAGHAEAAMHFYAQVFDGSQIEQIDHYQAGEAGTQGNVKHARFRLGEQAFTCIDSAVEQPFTFTPAISLLTECESEAAIEELFARLSENGTILMPLATYSFSRRFGWLTDRFGVSWQLNLA